MTEQQTKINERAVLAAVIAEGAGGKGQTEAQTAEYLDELKQGFSYIAKQRDYVEK